MLTLTAHGPNFDARLETRFRNQATNCDLFLILRIFLQPVNPRVNPDDRRPTVSPEHLRVQQGRYPDSDGQRLRIQRWGDSEWLAWKRRYEREVQAFWSGRFWLATPDSYHDLDWPDLRPDRRPTHRPNVYCRMDVRLTSSPANAHHMIRCVRLQNGEPTFRSNAILYSSRDLEPEALTVGSPFLTHYHEVGHLLGLGHAAEHTAECQATGDTNSAICYGVTQPQMQDVMGLGSRRNLWHAQPWCDTIAVLTQTRSESWPASMTRVAPRTLGDLSRGRAAMSRPAAILRR